MTKLIFPHKILFYYSNIVLQWSYFSPSEEDSKKLCWLTDPTPDVVTCFLSKVPVLIPFTKDWLKRGILLKLPNPAWFLQQDVFYVSKKIGKFDLSFFNWSVNPSFTETLQKILDLSFSFLFWSFKYYRLKVWSLQMISLFFLLIQTWRGLSSIPEVFHSSLEDSESS